MLFHVVLVLRIYKVPHKVLTIQRRSQRRSLEEKNLQSTMGWRWYPD